MKDILIGILETFGYPVRLQGSLAKDEQYPDSFFTFWNNSTDDGSHYDNNPIFFVWDFTVNFYSVDPDLVNSIMLSVRAMLRQAGWIVPGKAYDVPSDEVSHTGRGFEVLYIDNDTTEPQPNPDPEEEEAEENNNTEE